jgi:hypothetical protein
MADNTGMLIKVGIAGAVGYYAYTQGWLSFLGLGGLPSDALYIGMVPVGQTSSACGASPVTATTYVFHSASTGKYYCQTTVPTAAQQAAAQAAQVASAAGGGGTTVATGVPAPPATPPATPPPAAPSLDSLGAAVTKALGSQMNAAGVGPDAYNYAVTSVYPAAGPLPDPNQLFAGTGWARPAAMDFTTYWTYTAPWLKANKGLSGYGGGLGAYYALGALARRMGRA